MMFFRKIVRYIILGIATGIAFFAISTLAKPNVYTVDCEFGCLPPVAKMEEKVAVLRLDSLAYLIDDQVLVGSEYKPGYCYYVLIKGQLYR